MRSPSTKRAISPILGVVLLFAITVALAAAAGAMVLGFGDVVGNPPPFVASEESVDVTVGGNETQHTLEFSHQGGESVDASRLTALVSAGGNTTRIRVSELSVGGSTLADGQWSAGERLSVQLDESAVCGNGTESASIKLIYQDGKDGYTLSEQTVPVERGQFVIDGARVRATTTYTANVKFIGTGWSSSDDSLDPPVNVSIYVGGERAKSWRGVQDTTSVVGAYGVSRQESETDIEVRAAGAQPVMECGFFGFNCERVGWSWRRVSSTENTENVRVYRDGDDSPAFDGGSGQRSVATYIEPYVEDGEITLDANQAIYLFDFNEDNHDYQDAVVLVSFFTQQTEVGVHESKSKDVILCSAETRSASPNGGNGNQGNGNNGNG